MNKPILPLYNFFTRLRLELKLELDLQQYLLLLQVWQQGQIPVREWVDLLSLCQTLWLSRAGLQEKFRELFYEEFTLDCNAYFPYKPTALLELLEPVLELNSNPDESSKDKSNDLIKEKNRDRENAEDTPEPYSSTHEPPLALRKEKERSTHEVSIFVQFKTAETPEVMGGGTESKADLHDSKYIFSDKYFPINSRKVQQNWKYLQNKTKKVRSEVIDIPKCLEKLVQDGGLSTLQYQFRTISNQRVLVLIDSSHSMVAFEQLAKHLVHSLKESLNEEAVKAVYFNNVPLAQYLYTNGQQVKAPWLSKTYPHLILIISDAGAAKGNQHKERIETTQQVLREMQTSGSAVLWLNPMPKSRWYGSSALTLAFQVRMLEINDMELKQIPAILKRV